MRVRLFAGWDFKSGAAPTSIVRAMRDPEWANLDRIQIIKGWLDADGKAKERIYDIAVSGRSWPCGVIRRAPGRHPFKRLTLCRIIQLRRHLLEQVQSTRCA